MQFSISAKIKNCKLNILVTLTCSWNDAETQQANYFRINYVLLTSNRTWILWKSIIIICNSHKANDNTMETVGQNLFCRFVAKYSCTNCGNSVAAMQNVTLIETFRRQRQQVGPNYYSSSTSSSSSSSSSSSQSSCMRRDKVDVQNENFWDQHSKFDSDEIKLRTPGRYTAIR